jgi:hypothetical protein
MNYDDETQFNDKNITSFLAEVEEYISGLITYIAYQNENANAAISSIPLEKLAVKQFDKRSINV